MSEPSDYGMTEQQKDSAAQAMAVEECVRMAFALGRKDPKADGAMSILEEMPMSAWQMVTNAARLELPDLRMANLAAETVLRTLIEVHARREETESEAD